MAQSLLIGLGGTGSRVVNNVAKELKANGKRINDGEMFCAVIDTNVNDNSLIEESGTGIPVIPTSKVQKIGDYFDEYHHLHMETWCPSSPAFCRESMVDGASELRVKSRIAFMDASQTGGKMDELELMINEVLKNNKDSKIRVMIVSSLSGGTGSGMFIQVALWLRERLKESEITIRGIFMLPDIFISTIDDIKNNKKTVARHYCNAYAAIRELNAINKIKKSGYVPSEKMVLGELFDSIRDKDTGKHVFDLAFFIDDKDSNGVKLDSIGEYERAVAQLVYMQLYAPMASSMNSEEDNLFLAIAQNDEPLYGTCGTAKAVYPMESVDEYCKIRAARDSLTDGWRKIDSEIDALIEERKQSEKDGEFTNEAIDSEVMYMKIFDDKTNAGANEIGKDRFFLSISKDAKNEKKEKGENGKIIIKYTDKAEDFIKLIKDRKIDPAVNKCGGVDEFQINAEQFVSADHTVDQLKQRVRSDDSGIEDVVTEFDSHVPDYAATIVSSIFPFSMGEVNAANKCSIYGLFSKVDAMGDTVFIHPVAARYLLYKTIAKMEAEIKQIDTESSRREALAGGDIGTLFDNVKTKSTETTPEDYLKSKRWFQRTGKFLDVFEANYASYINTKVGLCAKYENECLEKAVFKELIERMRILSKQFETFFGDLDAVKKSLDLQLSKNLNATKGKVGKTIYVYGGPEEKERTYKSLDLDLGNSASRINESVISSVYGSVCAKKRPSAGDNKPYRGINIVAAFVRDTEDAFGKKIDSDSGNRSLIDLDIYTAVCRSADVGIEPEDTGNSEEKDILAQAIDSGEAALQRYKKAMSELKADLYKLSAPFLICDKEISDDELGTVTTRPKTFWGFSKAMDKACPFLGQLLGVNTQLQANDGYKKSEFYCYRAIYGLEAQYIPKFNELNNGDYYKNYKSAITKMVEDAEGEKGERALVVTPHLDKNWHRYLPYVSAPKQKQAELEFYHGFWLAVAYNKIFTDNEGKLFIKRSVTGGFGNKIDKNITVDYNGKQLTKTDVAKLLAYLHSDMIFILKDIPELEEKFKAELAGMTTYVGTAVLKGLTVKNEDTNPINIISRYNEMPGHNENTTIGLIDALEKIAGELAEGYNTERNSDKLDEAKFSICKKIYDSSKRSKGRSEVFGSWETRFKELKLN